MKIGVDTSQARRIHNMHTKLLWDQLDICKVDSWVATVSQLMEISEPEDWVTPPGCIGIELSRPPSERNYITTFDKIMPVSECCGLIARLGDAMRCLQPPAVFCIFEADAGQVRSLTSPGFQDISGISEQELTWADCACSRSRNSPVSNRHSSQEQSL